MIDWADNPESSGYAFTLSANWAGGLVPANDLTTHIARFSNPSPVHPVLNDSHSLAGLEFSADAGAYTLSGAGTLTLGTAGVRNDRTGSGSVIVNFNLALGANAAFQSDGALAIGGAVSTNGFALTLSGAAANTLSGAISGTGPLTKTDSGTWTLSGNNTYSGGTTITAGTLQIGSGTTTGQITGPIVVEASGTLGFNRSDSFTHAGNISGAGGVRQLGSGTVTLTGNNAYTGTTLLNGGTLALGSAEAIGDTGEIRFSGGRLRFSASNTTDYSSRFSSAANQAFSFDTAGQDITFASSLTSAGGTLRKAGAGTLTLTADNAFNGVTNVDEGTLRIGDGGTSGSVGGAISVASGAAVSVDRSDALTLAGISGAGAFAKNGSGTLTLSGNLSTTGSKTVQAGTLLLQAGLSGNLSVASGAEVEFDNGTDTYTNVVSGGGALVKSGTGVLSLTATQTYTGGTTIAGGTLQIGGASGALAGAIAIADGATLQWSRSSNFTLANTISGQGGFHKSGGGGSVTVTLSGDNTYTGTTTVSSGTLVLGSATGTGTGAVVVGTGATFNTGAFSFDLGRLAGAGNGTVVGSGVFSYDSPANSFLTNVIDGSGSLEKSGDGALTLAANNTYTGGTTINAGTLQLGNGGSLGAVAGSIVNDGTLIFDRSDAVVHAGAISGSGALIKRGGNTVVLTGTNTYSGGTTIETGTLRLGGNGTSGIIAGPIAVDSGATLDLQRSNSLTFSNAISGAGRVAISGSGALTLSGANSYTGGTTLSAGTLLLGSAEALGASGTITFAGGTLRFTADNTTDYSGRFSIEGDPVYRINTGGQAVTFASSLTAPSASLIKSGNGTLTLINANTFTGGVTISMGALELGHADALGSSGTITFSGGSSGTLRYTAANTVDYSNRFAVGITQLYRIDTNGQDIAFTTPLTGASSSLVKSGAGTLTLTAANTFADWTTVSAGTLRVGDGATHGALVGPVSVASGATLEFHRADNVTVTPNLSNAGSIVQLGSGTLTLSGNKSHTGAFTVAAGTLRVTHSLASSLVTVQNGATLGGTGTLTGAATIEAGGNVAPGVSPGTLTFAGGLTLAAGTIFDFELGSASDLIRLTGGDLIGPGGNGGITLNLFDAGDFVAGTYTLFDFSSAASLGDFELIDFDVSDFALGATLSGFEYSLAFAGDTLALTAVSAIPEPSTYAVLAGVGALGFAAWVRRRRRTDRPTA